MRRVAFLDRDGTLNVDRGHIFRIEHWEFVAGAIEALKLLQREGFALAVVTNQSAISRGVCTLGDVHQLHDYVQVELARHDVRIAKFAVCPHSSTDDCRCRKPRTGMYSLVAAALGDPIDLSQSWTIGDKPIDVEFGRRLGTRTALLNSRYWDHSTPHIAADVVADCLLDAVLGILDRPM